MRLLLDSHIVFWWVGDAPRLKRRHRKAIEAADEVFVSAATLFELGFKATLGRLNVDSGFMDDLPGALVRTGFEFLSITPRHAQVAAALPLPHRDPFDRILAGQTIVERLTFVTDDAAFARFGVSLLD